MTLIVNMYGGPSTGKSTTAAATFAELKYRGINCELVTEYAKDRVWDDHTACLSDQIYVFGKQYHRIHRLLNKVDVIITDAPLLLSIHYGHGKTPQSFSDLVRDIYGQLNNMDVFLNRKKKYQPAGRLQTEEQARSIDEDLKKLLDKFCIVPYSIDADQDAAKKIADAALIRLAMDKITPIVEKAEKFTDFLDDMAQGTKELTCLEATL